MNVYQSKSPYRDKNILVVAPFMHRKGHFSVFSAEMADGFRMNGANVTLLFPHSAQATFTATPDVRIVCLENLADTFNGFMRMFWRVFRNNPIMLCLAWLIAHVRSGAYDLVYWTDFAPDNQQSTWPLSLAAWLGLYRHRTAFTEHHDFSWMRHRWQRLFRLDRFRLRNIDMFVHSRQLLGKIRQIMGWPSVGHYIAIGLWPNPASETERRAARCLLSLPSEARVLLIFGMQAIQRKGIDTLATAIHGMTLDQPLTVLFAGVRVRDEPHPFDHPDLQTKHNLLIRHDESFIPTDMVKSYFAAADAVWNYYGNFVGSSAVLAQTIAFGRIPISAKNSESGELCRTYRLGLATPSDDINGVQSALAEFLMLPTTTQREMELATLEAAHAMSWPNIARRILDIIFAKHNVGRNA